MDKGVNWNELEDFFHVNDSEIELDKEDMEDEIEADLEAKDREEDIEEAYSAGFDDGYVEGKMSMYPTEIGLSTQVIDRIQEMKKYLYSEELDGKHKSYLLGMLIDIQSAYTNSKVMEYLLLQRAVYEDIDE